MGFFFRFGCPEIRKNRDPCGGKVSYQLTAGTGPGVKKVNSIFWCGKRKRQIIFWGEKVNPIFWCGKRKRLMSQVMWQNHRMFCFSRFHASPLHSEGGSRVWCLKTIDARQMNQSKLSGEQRKNCCKLRTFAVKTFSLKIWVCRFFDKFHVCREQ